MALIKLEQISETYQDCTADYDVIIDNENCTVIEFINLIINERKYDYGYIKVLDYKIKYDKEDASVNDAGAFFFE